MESVRVQLSGKRIRANGRIVAAATANNPAFGAHYDLQTDETGATKRFGLTVTLAERERQLAIARDEENMWLVTDHQGERRAAYNGALDIDLVFSPFFNALPIRRLGLHERAESIALPVVYVNVPEMSVVWPPTGDDAHHIEFELPEAAVAAEVGFAIFRIEVNLPVDGRWVLVVTGGAGTISLPLIVTG